MGKYIDGSGLAHLMGIIKGWAVPNTRTVNGHALSANVTVSKSDVGLGNVTNTEQAPKSHASTATTYGQGTDTNYGHVKLTDNYDSDSAPSGASAGIAASPLSVYNALSAAKTYADAYVNQNAFSNVKVGSTTIAADTTTDTLELVAGNGITLTPDTTNDKVTVSLHTASASNSGFSFADDGTLSIIAVGSDNNGLMTPALLTKLNGIATGAEVNQNAFSNVKVGSTTVAADAKTDTLELVAGSNVTLTPDATNDKVTIAATDTTALGSMTGTLGVAHGGTGVATLGAGVVYHSASGTGALSIATAANLVSALGTTAVNRATADASGNTITSTYAKLASPALTGTPTAPTAAAGTNTTQIATTAFVTNAVGTATAGALQYKGVVDAEATITGAAYKKGWYYVVGTAGTYAGKTCEVGDMLIAKQDKSSTVANDWDAVQSNIEVLSNSEIDTLWAAA